MPQETVAVTGSSKGCREMKQPRAADDLVEQSAARDASSAVGNACADRLVPFNSLPLLIKCRRGQCCQTPATRRGDL